MQKRLTKVQDGHDDEVAAFVTAVRACAKQKDLHKGSTLHEDILRNGFLKQCSDVLVIMYANCGALEQAKELLDLHNSRDVLAWTALITGYAHKGHGHHALHYFERMKEEDLSPNALTFASMLKACGSIRAADKGAQIHDDIAKLGLLKTDIVLGNSLVDMYVKCSALVKARKVLEELPLRNVVSWTSLITGYAHQGQGAEALSCFDQMKRDGISPNDVTYLCVLKACGSIRAGQKGTKIHEEIVEQGLLRKNVALGNALVDMYVKCGALEKARRVLEGLLVRDVISWNALTTGYAQQGEGGQVLRCFREMLREGLSPDAVTYIGILKACTSLGAVDMGEKFHEEIANQGLLAKDIILGTTLVDMYAKCGALAKAQEVLRKLSVRNVKSWNALISGYAEKYEGAQALKCFGQMQREGLFPDAVTFISILKACGSIKATEKGEEIHDQLSKQGLPGHNPVLGNALVDMYVKCGALAKARQVLEELPLRNVVSWSSIIAGYVEQHDGEQALKCFEQMQGDGLSPNGVTFLSLIKACSMIGAADKGENIHNQVVKQGLLKKDVVLGTAVVDMYAKCGALSKARKLLKELPVRDVISWNALIHGYAQECEGEQALNCLEEMQCEGISPDAATFSSVLSACTRACLLEDSHKLFIDMSKKYGLKVELEHYSCMIDLFGRSGCLNMAVELLEKAPPSLSEVWSVLLAACRKWEDVSVGRWAFEHAVHADKSDGSAYVLMANIYADADMQEDAQNVEAMRKENKVGRRPH